MMKSKYYSLQIFFGIMALYINNFLSIIPKGSFDYYLFKYLGVVLLLAFGINTIYNFTIEDKQK